jgi:hypothetical protein
VNRVFSLLMLSLAVLCAGAGIASAQSMPDLKGTWTGTSKSIVAGLAPHHPTTTPAKPAGPNRLTEVKFTIKVDGQEDGRFWGTHGSVTKVEPFIGVLSSDGKRLRVLTQGGGVIDGVVTSPDSIEIFYTEHEDGVSVAATNVWMRQK